MHPGAFGSRGSAAIVAMCVVGAPSVAFSQTKEEKALELYEKALAAYGEGNFRQASDLLAKAFVYDNNLIYQYNRILALQANGDYAEALEELDFYAVPMSEDPEARFADVPEIKTKLESQLAAKKKKEEDAKNNANKDPEDPKDTKDPKDPKEIEDPKETPKTEGSVMPLVGYGLVGAGGVALAAGGLLATGMFAENPNENGISGSEATSRAAAVESQQSASIGLLVGGVVLAGAGVAILVLSEDEEEGGGATAWTLTPYAGPDGGGAVLFGRF